MEIINEEKLTNFDLDFSNIARNTYSERGTSTITTTQTSNSSNGKTIRKTTIIISRVFTRQLDLSGKFMDERVTLEPQGGQ